MLNCTAAARIHRQQQWKVNSRSHTSILQQIKRIQSFQCTANNNFFSGDDVQHFVCCRLNRNSSRLSSKLYITVHLLLTPLNCSINTLLGSFCTYLKGTWFTAEKNGTVGWFEWKKSVLVWPSLAFLDCCESRKLANMLQQEYTYSQRLID